MLSEVENQARTAAIVRGRNRVLESLARGAPLAVVLESLTREAEQVFPNLLCSVLLLDGEKRRLEYGAAPNMPDFYVEATNGLKIGPRIGSCGAAAATGKRVVVEDVLDHPNWAAYRELSLLSGFRACWSEPIVSPGGEILGTFAMYYREPRKPGRFELDFIMRTAQVAGVAIEHDRAKEELHSSEECFRQLAESIREVFWLTDWRTRKTLYVSPAYETVWGRSCESLIDDPKSWSYDIHPDDRDAVVEAFSTADRGAYDIEYRIVRDDESIRWIHDRAFPIRNEGGEPYRIAGLSEDVTERKRSEERLRAAHRELDARTQRQLESLTTDLLLAEERERRTLAIDLHDGLNQLLSLARIKIAGLRASEAGSVREALEEIEGLLDRANRSARSLTFQLSPPVLYDLGFEPAVQWLVEDIRKSHDLDITLEESGCELALDDRVKVLLFRAVRELLINVAKHAKAHSARVCIRREERQLSISVQDDGVAFDPEACGRRGLGLGSITERLDNLGGSMKIDSLPGKGTTIVLFAPLAQIEP